MDKASNRIFCAHCGSENHIEATYCKQCGKQLIKPETTEEIAVIPKETEVEEIRPDKVSMCPFCHSENCRPVNKTNVKTHGGGFGFFNALIGFILMGPAGLLCGACGRSVHADVSNETWWVCPSCGKEFISKDIAIKKAEDATIRNAVLSALVFIFISLWMNQSGSIWLAIIGILGVIVMWALIPVNVEEASGYKIEQILTDANERKEFWHMYIAMIILGIIAGFGLGDYIGTL